MSILHNTKLWLIIIALGHTLLGVGGSLAIYGTDELAIIGFFSLTSVSLFYAAFMLEGQAQARLAAVICGPAVVWFVVCAALGLEMLGDPVTPMPEGIMPIVLWGLPALSGVLGWNKDEASPASVVVGSV
jgi:hypothetical protein